MGDGYLEFSSASSILGMGMGKFTRIGQSKGPVTFEFAQGDEKFYTYVNCDGENFRSRNTKSITIAPANFLQNNSITVL